MLTRISALPIAIVAIFALAFAACGDGNAPPEPAVTIEPIASATRGIIPIGGKAPEPTATATEVAPEPTAIPTDRPADVPEAPASEPTSMPATATAIPAPSATPLPAGPPTEGRWIDVDVTNFSVRLMDGTTSVREIAPIAVGAQIDTGDYLSTQTGLFRVHTMIEGLAYDAAFDTYISHWIGFDSAKDNGFHSLLKDETGVVVDSSTGRVSNGCIRTGDPEAIYAWAQIGMPVFVHN